MAVVEQGALQFMDEEREKERERKRESDRAYQIISDAQRFGYSCNTPSLRNFFF